LTDCRDFAGRFLQEVLALFIAIKNELLSSETSGNPNDASGAFYSGPRAPTEAVILFFQNPNLIPFFQYAGQATV
jgi:hypothetical protein